MKVDFPAPEGPIMAMSWLPGNFPQTLCKISLDPKKMRNYLTLS